MDALTHENVHSRIIWSADGLNPEDIKAKLETIGYKIAVKLDRLFFRQYREAAIELCYWLTAQGYLVFNDAKLVEIPSKLEALAKLEVELTQPWMLNCMATSLSTGRLAEKVFKKKQKETVDGIKLFVDACLETKPKVAPCAVTVLTTKSKKMTIFEFSRSRKKQVLRYTAKLQELGITHIVCSPREARAIRAQRQFDSLVLVCPGIRLPDSPPDDQNNSLTPGEAIHAGVNYLVVGRPISGTSEKPNLDPRATVEAIAADMLSAA